LRGIDTGWSDLSFILQPFSYRLILSLIRSASSAASSRTGVGGRKIPGGSGAV
jgi:hypothetical protein